MAKPKIPTSDLYRTLSDKLELPYGPYHPNYNPAGVTHATLVEAHTKFQQTPLQSLGNASTTLKHLLSHLNQTNKERDILREIAASLQITADKAPGLFTLLEKAVAKPSEVYQAELSALAAQMPKPDPEIGDALKELRPPSAFAQYNDYWFKRFLPEVKEACAGETEETRIAVLTELTLARLEARQANISRDLRNKDLSGIDFSNAILPKEMAGAILKGCNFGGANLTRVKFSDPKNKSFADLQGTIFSPATRMDKKTSFQGCDLRGAILLSSFKDVDLQGTRMDATTRVGKETDFINTAIHSAWGSMAVPDIEKVRGYNVAPKTSAVAPQSAPKRFIYRRAPKADRPSYLPAESLGITGNVYTDQPPPRSMMQQIEDALLQHMSEDMVNDFLSTMARYRKDVLAFIADTKPDDIRREVQEILHGYELHATDPERHAPPLAGRYDLPEQPWASRAKATQGPSGREQ